MALGRQNARTCWCVVLGLSSKAGRSVDCKVNTVQRCTRYHAGPVAAAANSARRPKLDLMRRMLQSLALLLFTAQCAMCMRLSSLRPRTLRTRPVMMVDGKGGLPPGIADRLSFQTGGSKVARQEEEALILWGLVKECYPSEEAAVTAVNKNSLILNPSMNSSAPSDRISGTCLPPFYA